MLDNILQELKEVDRDRLKTLLATSPLEKKVPDNIPEEAKFSFKISSEAVDRDGEIVRAKGIDLTWYKKNPIVLLNHRYSVENIIGKTTNIYQKGTDTFAEGYFSQTNPKAKLVQDLYNEKMVNVVSIWFIVKERDPNDRNIITKSEMLEFSICAIQSNREAERTDEQKSLIKKGIAAGLLPSNYDSKKEIIKEDKKNLANDKDIGNIKEQIQDLSKKFETLETSINTISKSIKSLADDKAKKELEAIEKAKGLKRPMQQLVNSLSKALEETKKV